MTTNSTRSTGATQRRKVWARLRRSRLFRLAMVCGVLAFPFCWFVLLPCLKLGWYEMLPQTDELRHSIGRTALYRPAPPPGAGSLGDERGRAEYMVEVLEVSYRYNWDKRGILELTVRYQGEEEMHGGVHTYGGSAILQPWELWRLQPAREPNRPGINGNKPGRL